MFMMGKVLAFVLFACMASVVVCGQFERRMQEELGDIQPATYVCENHRPYSPKGSQTLKEYGVYQKFSFSEAEFNQKFSVRLTAKRTGQQRAVYDLYENPTGSMTTAKLDQLHFKKRPEISVTFHNGETSDYVLYRIIFEYPTPQQEKEYHSKYVQFELMFVSTGTPQSRLYLKSFIIEADEKDVPLNYKMDDYVRRLPQYGWAPPTALTREEDLSVLVPVLDSLSKSQATVYLDTTNSSNEFVINAECIYVPMYTLYLVKDFFAGKDLSKSTVVEKEL